MFILRKKPCLQNLGAFIEAVLVCSSSNAGFFRDVAKHMTDEAGILAEVYVYDDPSEKNKKALRNAYNVVFVCDSQTLIDASAEDGQDHPFRKIFRYVRCFNPFAISYATVEKKSSPALKNLVFPKCMRVLHNLHRKHIDMNNAFSVAKKLAFELRHSIPRKERKSMRDLAKNGLDVFEDFYMHTAHSKNILYGAIAALVCLLNIVFPIILDASNTFFVIVLGLVYILCCIIAPIFGLYFVAKQRSELYVEKRMMIEHSSGDDDIDDILDDENRAKSTAFWRAMIMSVVLFVLFVFVSNVLESALLTTLFYGAFAVYYLLYGLWVIQNRKWLGKSSCYIEYAKKRQKFLIFVEYPKLWLKKLPLVLISAFVIFYILAVIAMIFGII